jgi:hypothetical protein
LAIDKLSKYKFIKILLYPGDLLEQCAETWRFFRKELSIFGLWGRNISFSLNRKIAKWGELVTGNKDVDFVLHIWFIAKFD